MKTFITFAIIALLGVKETQGQFLQSIFNFKRLLQAEAESSSSVTINGDTTTANASSSTNFVPGIIDEDDIIPQTDFRGYFYDCHDICMAPCNCSSGTSIWGTQALLFEDQFDELLNTTGSGASSSSSASAKRPGGKNGKTASSSSLLQASGSASNASVQESCPIVRHLTRLFSQVPKCNDYKLCWCPTPCSLLSEKWMTYNETKEREGLVLNLTEPETVLFENITEAKWLWMDIFNWPFPAPTPQFNDRFDFAAMDSIADAEDLFADFVAPVEEPIQEVEPTEPSQPTVPEATGNETESVANFTVDSNATSGALQTQTEDAVSLDNQTVADSITPGTNQSATLPEAIENSPTFSEIGTEQAGDGLIGSVDEIDTVTADAGLGCPDGCIRACFSCECQRQTVSTENVRVDQDCTNGGQRQCDNNDENCICVVQSFSACDV